MCAEGFLSKCGLEKPTGSPQKSQLTQGPTQRIPKDNLGTCLSFTWLKTRFCSSSFNFLHVHLYFCQMQHCHKLTLLPLPRYTRGPIFTGSCFQSYRISIGALTGHPRPWKEHLPKNLHSASTYCSGAFDQMAHLHKHFKFALLSSPAFRPVVLKLFLSRTPFISHKKPPPTPAKVDKIFINH